MSSATSAVQLTKKITLQALSHADLRFISITDCKIVKNCENFVKKKEISLHKVKRLTNANCL